MRPHISQAVIEVLDQVNLQNHGYVVMTVIFCVFKRLR